ncbi:UBX domain-containing protein 11 isoform X2 [Melospiza melodia melodia]|uniref:UBX domain-containing protein 11 isoform X2 n=1 Tax=Melospiza melodia melodia TaxID=1914991 RepID=UPI002FD08FE0
MAAGGAAHADVELVSSLAEKISQLEQKVEKQAQEIQLKDRRIAELEEKIRNLQEEEEEGAPDPASTEELELRCLELQSQVWEMEQCLQDILDGYFPSELQPRYPDGVPLQVTDRRDVVFQKPDLAGSFPGLGHVVGTAESNRTQETSKIPGPKCSREQDPNEVSQPLKHRGSVGSAQGAAPQGSDGRQSCEEILLETPGLAALDRDRARAAEQAGAPELCRLHVRSESGEQTYELRMLLTDTIGDLRQLLAHLRGGNSDYEILSTFPQRVYTDSSRSLQECGLVPRASLLLRRRDPSPGQGRGLQPA